MGLTLRKSDFVNTDKEDLYYEVLKAEFAFAIVKNARAELEMKKDGLDYTELIKSYDAELEELKERIDSLCDELNHK